MSFKIERLSDYSILRSFTCGIKDMDDFIQNHMYLSCANNYCKAYVVLDEQAGPIALFALNFDALNLDMDDKDELLTGISNAQKPLLEGNYKDTFINKQHYPALEISYLAVAEDLRFRGIGKGIVKEIIRRTREQEFAGCQFITVEALKLPDYSAVGFYEKCDFAPCEYLNPNKNTLRMFLTLYPDSAEDMKD